MDCSDSNSESYLEGLRSEFMDDEESDIDANHTDSSDDDNSLYGDSISINVNPSSGSCIDFENYVDDHVEDPKESADPDWKMPQNESESDDCETEEEEDILPEDISRSHIR